MKPENQREDQRKNPANPQTNETNRNPNNPQTNQTQRQDTQRDPRKQDSNRPGQR